MVLHPSSIWRWFESLTGQANAASLVGFLLSIATISVSVFGWYKSKLNILEVDRRELLEERARKDDKIARLGKHIADLEQQLNDARARHPEAALQLAEREWEDGNFWLGHKALEAWLIAEGTIIAPILLRRALLESAAAVGEERMSHLTAAQAYAIGALSLAPRDPESATVLTEIESVIADSAEEAAPLTAC